METSAAVEMIGITKKFGLVIANDDANLSIRRGEILSLLGENGSGKTTLMNMLSGIYYPDCGHIRVNGREVSIRSPRDAFELGIGMIHQHFKLVDVFTAAENIVLGLKEKGRLDRKAVSAKIREIASRYGFEVNPNQKVYEMSVSQKQTLEIVKVLYRGANILILDEPTAVLTPQETEKLFTVLRNMRADGKAVVIITHKLSEVLSVSDRVVILRKGRCVGEVATKDATESSLTEMMVGQKITLNIDRPETDKKTLRLSVRDLNVVNEEGLRVLKGVSFDAYGGEILGIAGVSGSGQKELLESVAGLQLIAGGRIEYTRPSGKVESLIGCSPRRIRAMGVALSFVPEDRLGMGLVGSMGMSDNMMLKNYADGRSLFTDRKKPRELARQIQTRLRISTPSVSTPVRRLSGGNVQKVLVGREIAASPAVLMTAYAVRGLDINTSYTIYHLLNEQKEKGVCVLYVGEDLDVLLALCDRILVLCAGRVSGVLDAKSAGKEQLGLLMTKPKEEASEHDGK